AHRSAVTPCAASTTASPSSCGVMTRGRGIKGLLNVWPRKPPVYRHQRHACTTTPCLVNIVRVIRSEKGKQLDFRGSAWHNRVQIGSDQHGMINSGGLSE